MTISRRSFLKAAAAIGASFAWAGAACSSRVHWQERRDLYPQGVASGDPDPHSVILWTRRPFDQGTRELLTVEVAEDEAFRRVVAHAQAPVSLAADWTARVLSADSSRRAPTGIASPTRRQRQPGRPHDHRAVAERSPHGELRLRELPGHQRGQAQRLSPDDLRGRTRCRRRPARFRSAPGRFHLRGRPVSRRGEDPLRPHDLRGRAHPGRPQGRQLPHPADRRRLPGHLQGLSRRSRPPGRARALAVRLHLGQPRVLLAGLAEHRQGGQVRAARPEHQDRGESGLVRIPPRARRAAERVARRSSIRPP